MKIKQRLSQNPGLQNLFEQQLQVMQEQLSLLTKHKIVPRTSNVTIQQNSLVSTSKESEQLETFQLQAPSSNNILINVASVSDKAGINCSKLQQKQVDFSMYFFGNYPAAYTKDKYDLIFNVARFADENNFKALWIPERHFHAFGGFSPNPSVMCAALARETKQIKLRPGSIVLPLHNPIRVAEEWSVVDNISSGRVDGFGVAIGWHADDFVLSPEVYGSHPQVLQQNLKDIKTLWSGGELSVINGVKKEIKIKLFPAPSTTNFDVWFTVVDNPETYKKAAQSGANILTNLMSQDIEKLAANIALYREELKSNGYLDDYGKVTVLMHTFILEDKEEARSIAKAPFCEYLQTTINLFKNLAKAQGIDFNYDNLSKEDIDYYLGLVFNKYVENTALIGDITSSISIIEKLVAVGVDEIAFFVDFGIGADDVLRSLSYICQVKNVINGKLRFELPKPQYYMITEAQRKLLNIAKLDNNAELVYHVSASIYFNELINETQLKNAINALLKNNPILSTCFVSDNEITTLNLAANKVLKIVDLREIKIADEAALAKFLDQDSNTKFDLTNGPLIRFSALHLKSSASILVISAQHIIVDGWSMGLLLEELLTYYNNLQNQEFNFRRMDFTEYTSKISEHKMIIDANNEYWYDKLKSSSFERVCLVNQVRNKVVYKAGKCSINVNIEMTQKLRATAAKFNCSTFMLLLSVYQILLHKLSNQSEFIINIIHSGRFIDGVDDFIGFSSQVIPIIAKLEQTLSIKTLTSYVKKAVLESFEHDAYSFVEVCNKLNFTANEFPFSNYLFNMEHGLNIFESNPNVKSIVINKVAYIDYDVMLNVMEWNKELIIDCTYNKEFFLNETINCFLNGYVSILNEIVTNPDLYLSDLTPEYLDKNTYQKVIYDWNSTDKAYPEYNKTIHQLFEEQVSKTPDNIALVYEDIKLTYRELNKRSNQLAHYIRNQYQIKPDDLIALCLNRSEYMLIAILGVLKAGGAYVPIDPDYPIDRINYILIDTKTKVVLLSEQIAKNMVWNNYIQDNSNLAWQNSNLEGDQVTPALVVIDSKETLTKLAQEKICNIKTRVNINNLAYVIYTSGTTGKPKGVMIEHKGVVNRINWMNDEYPLMTNDRILQKTPYVFDVSVWELLWSLWHGASVVFAKPDGHKDPDYLIECINQYKISIVHFVPSMLDEFNAALLSGRDSKVQDCRLSTLRYVFCSGEALKLNSVKETQKLLPQVEIHNLYGPTEASVDALYYSCAAKDLDFIGIGKPISNMMAYVLDNHLHPLPLGVIGELYIGGIGLARGYLNLPELTKERFIANPFQREVEKIEDKNGKLYKTGDLVRWLANGNIEYIGRNDSQVKIRGYRIELSEIEVLLSNYSNIKQSVVLALNHKNITEIPTENQYLAAYYTADSKLDETMILNYLSDFLPEYMLPSVFVYLKKIPLTINGKLDRKALPNPEFTNCGNTYLAPRNELEIKIVAIFAKVLNIEAFNVGVLDNFFKLGGNSITAIKLASRLNKETEISINALSIFKYPTIDKLAHYAKHNQEYIVIPKLVETDPTLQILSFAQERLWFIDQYEGGSKAYNIPIVLKLINEVNINILKDSLRQVVHRHEVLRTIFKQTHDGVTYQFVLDDVVNPLVITEQFAKSKNELTDLLFKEVNHTYNLHNEYPIRINIIYELINNARHELYLNIVIHHIAFDGWSVDVFLRDLNAYYKYYDDLANQLDNVEITLPELTIQYKDFAHWQKLYLSGAKLAQQLEYWQSKLSGYENLNLITDRPRPARVDYCGDDLEFNLDSAVSKKLRDLAKELGVSLYGVLLSGFYLMLYSYTNQDDIVIGTPVANRNHQQIEDLIGFFVNTLALRIRVSGEQSIKDFIQQVGQSILEAQLHQDLPFEKLVEVLNIDKDNSRHSIFQVMFAMQSFGSNLPKFTDSMNREICLFTDYPINELFKVALFDLMVMIDDSGNHLTGVFNYAAGLFYRDTIKCYITTYTLILEQFAELVSGKQKYEELKILNIHYLNKIDFTKQVVIWNQIEISYQYNKTIHQLFEEQVSKTPNNIALVYEDIKLTYRELNKRSNQLAHYIRNQYQIKPDDLIALCLNRSEYMLIAILGVLKAGGAYVPIDPNFPDERIAYILEDTQTKVVISNKIYESKIKSIILDVVIPHVLVIDNKITQNVLAQQKMSNLQIAMTATNLVYVMYTSGTTGKPKGVMLEHLGCIIRINYMIKNTHVIENDTMLFKTNYIFDVSFSDIFCTLLSGAKLYLTKHLFDIDEIQKALDNRVTLCHFVPSQFAELKNVVDFSQYSDLTRIMFSGEALDVSLTQSLIESSKIVLNYYGPTETGEVTLYTLTNQNKFKDLLNRYVWIGKPFAGTKLYVLSQALNVLPIGTVGELYISGVGLSRGYLNLPDLTKERFIANPFQNEAEKIENKNARLYKTGDLVRWLPDGNLEYIGRNDSQVKIRGFRVELGEIEAAFSKCPNIRQNVVLAFEYKDVYSNVTGNKYLVGYYVAETKLDETEILNYLSNHLPEYMLPNILVYLEKFPLTINGKLDRKALPHPEFTDISAYIGPKNELEKKLVKIYANILNLDKDKISITDNFFKLGGNSILAIRLAHNISRMLRKNINGAAIFNYSNVEKLANKLKSLDNYYEAIITKHDFNNQQMSLILIHPGHTGAECYMELMKLLPQEIPSYAIESYNLYNSESPLTTIEDLASHYIGLIKESGIKGPYNLLGWSLGGVIAFEMAKQLKENDNDVNHIYLLDSFLDADIQVNNTIKTQDYEIIKKHILDNNASHPVSYQIRSNVFDIEYNASINYKGYIVPEKEVTLFKALRANGFLANNPQLNRELELKDNGWSNYIKELRIIPIDSDHFSLLKDNALQTIMKEITKQWIIQ